MIPGNCWQSLISSLRQVSGSTGWLVYLLIKTAAEAALSERDAFSQRIHDMLFAALSPAYFYPDNAEVTYYQITRIFSIFDGR